MGCSESRFRNKVEENNNECKNKLCTCGNNLYAECMLEYKVNKDWNAKQIKCKVFKKKHCEICHTDIDPNIFSPKYTSDTFDNGIENLSKLSVDHCCKCKHIVKESTLHCKECCVTYAKRKKHCCKCKRFYDRENEVHCCACNCVYRQGWIWQDGEQHCCKCKMVYKEYHCCECKVAWKVSHTCPK
jgi:hypothetical protein